MCNSTIIAYFAVIDAKRNKNILKFSSKSPRNHQTTKWLVGFVSTKPLKS
jgi:hypothetical protein